MFITELDKKPVNHKHIPYYESQEEFKNSLIAKEEDDLIFYKKEIEKTKTGSTNYTTKNPIAVGQFRAKELS